MNVKTYAEGNCWSLYNLRSRKAWGKPRTTLVKIPRILGEIWTWDLGLLSRMRFIAKNNNECENVQRTLKETVEVCIIYVLEKREENRELH
jgi:hypothetical protein